MQEMKDMDTEGNHMGMDLEEVGMHLDFGEEEVGMDLDLKEGIHKGKDTGYCKGDYSSSTHRLYQKATTLPCINLTRFDRIKGFCFL